MGRITDCFDKLSAEGRTGLAPYLTVGYPTLAETPDLVAAAVAGGACMVELGIPFSDPLADGATIQRASAAALDQGVHISDSLLAAKAVRAKGVTVPLLFMGYYNTFLSFGLPAFCQQAKEAGADGVICVDLPPEEAEPFLSAAASQGTEPYLSPCPYQHRRTSPPRGRGGPGLHLLREPGRRHRRSNAAARGLAGLHRASAGAY